MPRPPSIVWYYKQYLGDNAVLSMDWDVRGMHVHLLMLSIQEKPPGTIPADDAAIRRFLSLPSGSVDTDRVWRRVKSQLLAAWQPEGDRWVNRGMVETCQRRERYASRYENGTKTDRKTRENYCNSNKSFSSAEEKEKQKEKAVPNESPPSDTPEDLARGLAECLGLVPVGYMLKSIADAIQCAAARRNGTLAQGFDYLIDAAGRARERGVEINNFWFGNADGWEPKSRQDHIAHLAALGRTEYDTSGNKALIDRIKQGKHW